MYRMLSAAVVVAVLALASPSQARAQTYTFHTVSLLSFHEYTGNYASADMARAKGMNFQLNANGTFTLAMPNTWYGTITGHWTISNNVVYFSGIRTLSTGVGNNYVYVQGDLFVSNGKTYFEYTLGAGNSVGAVINGADFGSYASDYYYAGMQVSQ